MGFESKKLTSIANAQVTQSKVGLEYIALGDGNGAHYVPTQNQIALVHEVWRGPISELSIDPTNSNRIIIDAVIPVTAGGFTIREIGIFDDKNQLIAIGQYPEKYKPLLSEGVSEETVVHFVIETNNADVVKLTIDPTVIVASRNYVDGKVAQVQTELTEHSGQSVASENGAHGIRYFNNKLGFNDGADWSEIEIGKPNANGTLKINNNHATRAFTEINFSSSEVLEILRMKFADLEVSGVIKMMVATNRDVTNSVGGAEIILNVAIDQGGTLVASSMEILTISPTVARDFRCGSAHTMDNVLTISVYKKKTKVPLYIELDYITSLGNAFEVLDSITTNIDLGSVADTNPPQQSIFTHVGNSKVTLAASITGKGVQTSADATFVQMAANIDAIPAKLMMTGTKLSPSNTYSFKFAKVTGTLYQPYISIEDIPFAPKIIRVFSMTLTGNVEEYSSLYIAEDEGLGVNLSRHVTGYFGGATATGQDSYLMIASVTSLNGKWAVIMPVPLVSRYYKYTIVG